MRIAYVVTRADAVGGASIHVRDMAHYLAELGHTVCVFLGGDGPVAGQIESAGISCRRLRRLRRPVHPLHDVLAIRELRDALAEYQPGLVSLHTAKAGFVGRLAAARLGIPALYTPHGWTFGDRSAAAWQPVYRLAERLVVRYSAAILCVCRHERDLAFGLGPGVAGKLRVVYNGVHDIPGSQRARPGASPVRVLSVARLEEPKDPGTLLRALATLRDRTWELDLVGDGPMEAALRGLAAALGIGERVHFHGYHPDPAQLLSAAQVFVLSSRAEAFPRSILEAMRAGLPVVASRVGGIEEAISHQEHGLLVAPGDPAPLASALGGLIDDANLREKLGLQARRRYEAEFRFERMAAELLSVYREFC